MNSDSSKSTLVLTFNCDKKKLLIGDNIEINIRVVNPEKVEVATTAPKRVNIKKVSKND